MCYGDALSYLDDKSSEAGTTDLALDLNAAIGELENPRQREVMRLSLLGYTYQEIADRLSEANEPGTVKVTYEMVRGAFERARAVLKKLLASQAT
jgi:DNA-directed RNA polymerase specialized sigma24 family protein